jgi:hypothetical protein
LQKNRRSKGRCDFGKEKSGQAEYYQAAFSDRAGFSVGSDGSVCDYQYPVKVDAAEKYAGF